MRIQMPVDTNPRYTWGSVIGQPRCKIERNDSVDLVRGKNNAGALSSGCMPSMGQIIPHNMISGKNDPRAM
jgi:hypothetical protein